MSTTVDNVTFRRATANDVPRFVELIAAANLPPLFIAEYLDGFIAAEADGGVIACGGLEMYGQFAVIRSVVIDEQARGLGLGARMAAMLEDDARAAGATDIYLFTGDALEFWRHRGFVEVTFDQWARPPRLSWQYQFCSQNLDLIGEIHPMWRKA